MSFSFRHAQPELYWLAKQLRTHFYLHFGSFVCIAAVSLIVLLPPLALGWLVDKILPGRHLAALFGLVVLLFFSFLSRNLLTNLGAYLTMTAAQRISLELRLSLMRHLDTLSADYYESIGVGRVVFPLQEPIERIAYFGSDLLPAILRLLVTLLFTITTMFILSPGLTLIILPLVPVFFITRRHFREKLAVASDAVQQRQALWNDFLIQHFAALMPIQLLGQEKRQERKAFQLLASLVRSQQRLFRSGIYFTAFTSLSITVAMSLSLGYGGWRVFAGQLTAGRLVAFYSLITQLFEPLSGASEIYARAQTTFADIRQVHSLLVQRPSITDSLSATSLAQTCSWSLEIRSLEFRYPRQNVRLRIPSLRVPQGEQMAVIGENGAGKSTFAKLLVRVYDVKSGSISIAGTDIRNLSLSNLRQSVCYLSRDPTLFHGSVTSNLRFANPSVSNSQLQETLRQVGLSAFLDTANASLQKEIGPNGCQLSGGQRQRLAIARALLLKPRILILDEATSCLDPVSESLILRNIRRHLPASTLIVITHRLSTISDFSRILVLCDGRIAGDGTHAELAAQCEAYLRLFSPRDSAHQYVSRS